MTDKEIFKLRNNNLLVTAIHKMMMKKEMMINKEMMMMNREKMMNKKKKVNNLKRKESECRYLFG